MSTGLVVALRKRLENTNEFVNLLNQWVTTPIDPKDLSINNSEALHRLTLLVAALGSSNEEDSGIKLPQLRAMNLLQSIRRWISDSNALKGFEDQNEHLLRSLLFKLLNALAYQVQELPGAHWEMMFDFISSAFKGLEVSDSNPFVMLVLERTCRLAINLIELGDGEDDIANVWEDHSESISTSALHLMGREIAKPETASLRMDHPVRQYLEALSQVCDRTPDKLVLSHGSITEHCRLLVEPQTPLQMLAYKQLQTMLVEQVQALSIQMEIKAPASSTVDPTEEEDTDDNINSTEDKMVEPKFPASLWKILSNPPGGFPAMDVDVDADDAADLKKEFSLLSVGQSHEEDEENGADTGVAAKSEKIVSHTVLGYLLAWKLAFTVFENTVGVWRCPLLRWPLLYGMSTHGFFFFLLVQTLFPLDIHCQVALG